jgi:hypothetical protein
MKQPNSLNLARVRTGLFILLLASLALVSAQANTIYTYQGTAMISRTDLTALCPAPCVLTGSFTFAAPLPANFAGTVNPITTSFTDGTMVLDNFNSSVSATVMTDAQGNIAGYWAIQLDAFDQHHTISTINAPGNIVRDLTFNFTNQGVYEAYNFNSAGYWTESQSATPEPASLLLLGSGLMGALAYGRRRLGL